MDEFGRHSALSTGGVRRVLTPPGTPEVGGRLSGLTTAQAAHPQRHSQLSLSAEAHLRVGKGLKGLSGGVLGL